MARTKSPLHVVGCQPWPFPRTPGTRRLIGCRWACRGDLKAARFNERYSPWRYAILHPSTKRPGAWQVSRFDEQGALGDVIRPTCSAALKDAEIIAHRWKLVEVA